MLGLDFLRALQKEDFLENLEAQARRNEETTKAKNIVYIKNSWRYDTKNIWKVGKQDADL